MESGPISKTEVGKEWKGDSSGVILVLSQCFHGDCDKSGPVPVPLL